MTVLTDVSERSGRPDRETVAEVLRAMAADADVQGELVHAARSHSPEVARLAEAETHWHVTAMINAAGAWLGDLGERGLGTGDSGMGGGNELGIDTQDFAAALLLGADRAAQGVPMTAVLRGVQAAHTRAVEITVDRCRSAGVPDAALLTAVLRLKEYGDALQRHVVHGYRAAEWDTPRALGETRARLLRRLLVEGEPPPAAEELTRAGLRQDAVRHLLVARPGGDPARTRRLTHRLAALRGCLFGMLDGRLVGLYPRLPAGGRIDDGEGEGRGSGTRTVTVRRAAGRSSWSHRPSPWTTSGRRTASAPVPWTGVRPCAPACTNSPSWPPRSPSPTSRCWAPGSAPGCSRTWTPGTTSTARSRSPRSRFSTTVAAWTGRRLPCSPTPTPSAIAWPASSSSPVSP